LDKERFFLIECRDTFLKNYITKVEVNHMKVAEAARLLGVTPTTIRIGLQKGVFPFGVAFKMDEHNKNYKYVIYPGKLKEYAGVFMEGEYQND